MERSPLRYIYTSAWIIYQFLCYFAASAFFFLIYLCLRSTRKPAWRKWYVNIAEVSTAIMLVILIYSLALETVRITDERPVSYDDYNSEGYFMGGFEDVGNYIKENLPENSAIILESTVEYDLHYLMFFADRSVYYLGPESNPSTATIRENGGIPYMVSVEEYSYPTLYESPVRPYYRVYTLE